MIEAVYHAIVLEERLREERRMDPLAKELEQRDAVDRFEDELFGGALMIAFGSAAVFLLLMFALVAWLTGGGVQ